LNVLLYFFGELAMDFLLRNVPFSPAILSHGPVHFSGTSILIYLQASYECRISLGKREGEIDIEGEIRKSSIGVGRGQ